VEFEVAVWVADILSAGERCLGLHWDSLDETGQNCSRGFQKIFLLRLGRKPDSPKPSRRAQVKYKRKTKVSCVGQRVFS
jgi:hypothetical protein